MSRPQILAAVLRPHLVAGAVLLLAAALLSPFALLAALGIPETHRTADVLKGAELFRIGLAILGIVTIVAGQLPLWKSEPQPVGFAISAARSEGRLALGILTVILAGATALRFHELDSGLWLDEILTSALFANLPVGLILTSFESENQHFLYSLLAHWSLDIFGEGPWALRLPAALLGVGCVWALYLVAREVASVTEALLAAGMLAVSYIHVWFSQNARGYSGLLFVTLLSSWLLLRAIRTGDARNWVFYGVAVALGAYIHATMIFVVVGHGVIFLVVALVRRPSWRQHWIGGSIGFGLAGLLTFQLYALVLPQIMVGMGREESVVEAWKSPLWTLLEVVKGMQLSFTGTAAALGTAAVFLAGAVSYARTKPEVLGLLIIPAALGAAVVIGLGHHLWPRFFFFAMGFGVLVAIRGAMVMGQAAGRLTGRQLLATSAGPALCLALVALSVLSVPRAYGPKQDYVGAATFIETNRQPDDAIVMAGLAVFPYKQYYGKDWVEVRTLADLDAARSLAARTWLVYTFPPVLEAVHPQIMSAARSEFQVVSRFDGTVAEGAIYVSRFDSPQGLATR